MVVVHASVVVDGFLSDGMARDALADGAIHVPHHTDAEVLQTFRRHVAAGRLGTDAAVTALKAWRRLGVHRHALVGSLGRMWRLRENMTAYDAAYIALAERLGCDFITMDARLARAPGSACTIRVLPPRT